MEEWGNCVRVFRCSGLYQFANGDSGSGLRDSGAQGFMYVLLTKLECNAKMFAYIFLIASTA